MPENPIQKRCIAATGLLKHLPSPGGLLPGEKKNGFFIGRFFGDAIGYGMISELDWGKHPKMFFFFFQFRDCDAAIVQTNDMI